MWCIEFYFIYTSSLSFYIRYDFVPFYHVWVCGGFVDADGGVNTIVVVFWVWKMFIFYLEKKNTQWYSCKLFVVLRLYRVITCFLPNDIQANVFDALSLFSYERMPRRKAVFFLYLFEHIEENIKACYTTLEKRTDKVRTVASNDPDKWNEFNLIISKQCFLWQCTKERSANIFWAEY